MYLYLHFNDEEKLIKEYLNLNTKKNILLKKTFV